MTVSEVIDATLTESELEYERPAADTFIANLPGERRLNTQCLLQVGAHGVRIEAFVCRHPDENAGGVHEFLLRRNRKLYGVSYTIDRLGDIYLVGRISTGAVSADEIDRILGQVVEAANADFNTLLELGFAESIRREWKWRVSRGESLKNLQAFEHLVSDLEH